MVSLKLHSAFGWLLLGVAVLAAGCSSATVGGEETLSQADKALELQLESSLRTAAVAEETFKATTGAYTADLAALKNEAGLTLPTDVTLTIKSADAASYCIEATHSKLSGTTWHTSAGGAPTQGPC
jgi:hypothetical protein